MYALALTKANDITDAFENHKDEVVMKTRLNEVCNFIYKSLTSKKIESSEYNGIFGVSNKMYLSTV